MAEDLYSAVLGQVPDEMKGAVRSVDFYVIGKRPALRLFAEHLKEKGEPAVTSFVPGGMKIRRPVLLSRDALVDASDQFGDLSESFGLKYDGFEIALLAAPEEREPIPPFEKAYKPGETFAMRLRNGKWAYGIFLAASRYSILFDFKAILTEQLIDAAEVDRAPSLYRQPVMGPIDHRDVTPLGQWPGFPDRLPRNVYFRINNKMPSQKQFTRWREEFGITGEQEEDYWLLLKTLLAHGITFKASLGISFYHISISKRGRISSKDVKECPVPDPMTHGVPVTKEILESALIDGVDKIAIDDQFYR